MELKKKRVLITGGAGFFGSHIASRALSENCEILIIDILNNETSPSAQKEKNISELRSNNLINKRNFNFLKINITDSVAVTDAVKKFKPHITIHVAALTMDRRSMDAPTEFIQTNIYGTQVLLDALSEVEQHEQFIFISTRSAIGEVKLPKTAIKETNNFRPINPYGASKAAAESFIYSWHNDTKKSVKICRMQPLYGPRCRHDMLPYRVFNSIINNIEFTKFGEGDAIRDWLYVEDAVDAIFLIIKKNSPFDIFNIGTGKPTSTNSIISTCEKVANKALKIRKISSVRGDAHYAGVADVSKIYNQTGWKFKIDLEEGLKKTYEYMKKNS
jgi:nucleoside-diphosphate-sugar epimerase